MYICMCIYIYIYIYIYCPEHRRRPSPRGLRDAQQQSRGRWNTAGALIV